MTRIKHIKKIKVETAVELGYNVMEDIFVFINEYFSNNLANFMVNTKKLIGTTEYLTL
jgi:hypothetical protein